MRHAHSHCVGPCGTVRLPASRVPPRRAGHFLCVAKESNQRKATRMKRPSLREGFLAVLGLGVHRKTRCAALRSNSCDESVVEACCARHPQPCAPQRSIRDPKTRSSPSASCAVGSRSEPGATSRRCRRRAEWYWGSSPRKRRRGAQGLGRCAKRTQALTHCGCLSGALAQRVPQCSPKPEHHREPAQRAPNPGSPFFGYFLWRSKESDSAAGPRPGLQASTHHTESPTQSLPKPRSHP